MTKQKSYTDYNFSYLYNSIYRYKYNFSEIIRDIKFKLGSKEFFNLEFDIVGLTTSLLSPSPSWFSTRYGKYIHWKKKHLPSLSSLWFWMQRIWKAFLGWILGLKIPHLKNIVGMVFLFDLWLFLLIPQFLHIIYIDLNHRELPLLQLNI